MIDIQIEDMMNAGAHFGHQTKRWNPKMRPYLYGARSGVHIIDLQKTKALAAEALDFITKQVGAGKNMLFVGTKPQAREIIQREAARSSMFYVTDRWMGGTLTNFQTIKKSIDRLIDLETRRANNDLEGYTKKEKLDIDRTIEKLLASLGGIKSMKGVPGIIFVVDPKQEYISILEAKKLGIPVVAITDSNCNPDPIDYIIPGNDDALSSIEYFTIKVADACLAGLEKREANATQIYDDQNRGGDKGKGRRGPRSRNIKSGEAPNSYVSKAVTTQTFEGDATEGFSAKTEVTEAPATETAGE